MDNIFEAIKAALVKSFKGLFSAYDVFCEDAARTEGVAENWVYIELTPAANQTVGPEYTDRRVLVDVSIHNELETNACYLAIMPAVEALLSPVFCFADRAITVDNLELKVVDKVLHCIFTLAFRDSAEEMEPAAPYMTELDVSYKK